MIILLQQNREERVPLSSPPCLEPPFNARGGMSSFLIGHLQKSAACPKLCSLLSRENSSLFPLSSEKGFLHPKNVQKLVSDDCTTTPKNAIFIRLSQLNPTFLIAHLKATYNYLVFLSIKKHVSVGVVGQGLVARTIPLPHHRAEQLQPRAVGTSMGMGTSCP